MSDSYTLAEKQIFFTLNLFFTHQYKSNPLECGLLENWGRLGDREGPSVPSTQYLTYIFDLLQISIIGDYFNLDIVFS